MDNYGATVEICQEFGLSFADVVDKIAKKFSMSYERAEGEVKEYWQDWSYKVLYQFCTIFVPPCEDIWRIIEYVLIGKWVESQLFKDMQTYGFDVLAFPTMKSLDK